MKIRSAAFILIIVLFSCSTDKMSEMQIKNKNIRIEINSSLHSRVIADFKGQKYSLGDYGPSEFVTIAGRVVKDFSVINYKKESVQDNVGTGSVYVISGDNSALRKVVTVTCYDDFPTMAIFQTKYINRGDSALTIDSWTNNYHEITSDAKPNDEPVFWSYQSGSYENRPDWVLPLKEGFDQKNYMGMNASDYGGGTPVSDVWRKDVGIAVGHVELVPKLVSIPVQMPANNRAYLSVTYEVNKKLNPGDSLLTFKTFVAVHQGDYFQSLTEYRRFMMKQGTKFDKIPQTAYKPIWCAWGYERNFKVPDVLNTLPKVKELGYKWAVLDDGWQTAEGDWYLNPQKFPGGVKDMRAFVDKIHSYGLKAKLWWAPLAVDPGTDLYKNHPELLLINKDGKTQDITWWDSYYLCPAYSPTIEYTKALVKKFLQDWGFDGLKIDGQHLNAAPPCYNPAHKHTRPEEAVEQVPQFFKAIYETALSIKPDAVVEICPCGTAYSFFTMPYMNQPVSSDPSSSWQIRLKGKTFKALMGPSTAFYGDHVELSDGRCDFASTVGIGGVPGSKFTWPVGIYVNTESGDVSLTPEKEVEWKKWNRIYLKHNLAQGEYLGALYDIGFDKPEAHAIKKDGRMYYAFYANHWDGEIELRGLENKKYHLVDYVNENDYGSVSGPLAKFRVSFNKSLLLAAIAE